VKYKAIQTLSMLILSLVGYVQASGNSTLTVEQAQVVQRLIRQNSIMIHYCESCKTEKVEIWHLKKLLVDLKQSSKPEYKLQAYGAKLYKSQKTLNKGESDKSLFFRSYSASELKKSFLIKLDINHIYIPSEDYKSFILLSHVMEIASTNKRSQIKLPKDLVAHIRKKIK
jgi:hypothetical protein